MLDTEEEFDWHAPFSRQSTGVDHLLSIATVQAIFDRFSVTPTYVIDYPVASQPNGYRPLREIADSGRATIGAHMHPWVTPPMTEDVSGRNSFTCNLPRPLQAEKLQTLVETIERNLGQRPRIYKAGRYGIGRDTLDLLDELGFEIDQSVLPHYDFSNQHGPSFREFTAEPFLFGPRQMLAVPCTAAYVGAAGPMAPAIYELASSPALAWSRLNGIVTRLRLADRLMLSPEGFSLDDMRRVARTLVDRGTRVLTMTLHSPSIQPGHTPYVRTASELRAFLDTMTAFFDFFFGELGGVTTTPAALRQSILGTITR